MHLNLVRFPPYLLCLTLFRLSLNIASTRMILTKGVAGDLIQTFGDFVIQGNPFIGLLLFFLLSMINYVVVTKGAGEDCRGGSAFYFRSIARETDGDR